MSENGQDDRKRGDDPTGTVVRPPRDDLTPAFAAIEAETRAREYREAAVDLPACLVVARGDPEQARLFPLVKPDLIVGRDPSAEICIGGDPSISKSHLKIFKKNDQHFVEDTGSTNGTQINWQRIPAKEPFPLRKGDLLTLGATVLKYLPAGEIETLYHWEKAFGPVPRKSAESPQTQESVASSEQLRLDRRIGSGGMGEVFEATRINRASGFEKRVAVKRIKASLLDNPRAIERFREEARLAQNLSHPNIVQIFDVEQDSESGQDLIVMEYIQGKTLRDLIEPEKGLGGVPIDPERALDIARQILAGLKYAHNFKDPKTGKHKRIIHADINPRNVMVTDEGVVKILDFGIGRALDPEDETELTQFPEGSRQYLSPERAAGMRADEASDYYAAGLVLFEMLTGRKVFDPSAAATERITPRDHTDDQLGSIVDRTDLSNQLKAILKNWLKRNPDDRKVRIKPGSFDYLSQHSAQNTEKKPDGSLQPEPLERPLFSKVFRSPLERFGGLLGRPNSWAYPSIFALLIAVASGYALTNSTNGPMRKVLADFSSLISAKLKTQQSGVEPASPRFTYFSVLLRSEKRKLNFEDQFTVSQAAVRQMAALACANARTTLLDLIQIMFNPVGSASELKTDALKYSGVSPVKLPQLLIQTLGTDDGESTLRRLSSLCGRFESIWGLATIFGGFREFSETNQDAVYIGQAEEFNSKLQDFRTPAWSKPITDKAYSQQNRPRMTQADKMLVDAFGGRGVRPIPRPDGAPDKGVNYAMFTPPHMMNEDMSLTLLDSLVVGAFSGSIPEYRLFFLPLKVAMLSLPNTFKTPPVIVETLTPTGEYEVQLSLSDADLSLVLKHGICVSQRFGEDLKRIHSKCFRL